MVAINVVAAITGLNEGKTERSLDVIDTLADPGDVEVAITHVYDEDDEEKLVEMFDIDLEQPRHLDAVAEHNTAVQEFSSSLEDRGISYVVRGAIGDPTTEVLEVAEDEDADFVLVAGRERSPAGKAIFGSTSQQILLNSVRPVIFVGVDES